MMRISKLLTILATFALVSTSCQTDNTNSGKDPRAVKITITQDETSSRAIGDNVADKAAVTFTDGVLLFVNPTGGITKVVDIESGSKDYTGSVVGKANLESGVLITGVPSLSSKVAFIGNPSAELKAAAKTPGTNLAALEASVASQASGGGVDKVILYNEGELAPTSNPSEFTASLQVKPVVNRFEIGKIEGTHSAGGSLTYQVRGIFIDGYHNKMGVNGTAVTTTGNITKNGDQAAAYVGNTTGGYTAALSGVVYDWASSGNLPAPAANKSWAYNLLAPAGAAMPAIVIKLDNVSVNSVAMPGEYFLTIEKFYRNSPSSGRTQILNLEQGKIFAIPTISFNENDIAVKPYQESKSATVTIELLKWAREEIEYDI
jgi:hypothetical protein